jgi:hypothetical protein
MSKLDTRLNSLKTIRLDTYTDTVPDDYTGIVEWEDGSTWTLKEGMLHSYNDLPAVENSSGTKEWCKNGVTHRINGPAIKARNGDKWYYINDEQVTKEAHELYVIAFSKEEDETK